MHCVRKFKTVLDSGFFVSGTWIPDSLSCFPDSKVQNSGFHAHAIVNYGQSKRKTLNFECRVDNSSCKKCQIFQIQAYSTGPMNKLE